MNKGTKRVTELSKFGIWRAMLMLLLIAVYGVITQVTAFA